MAKERTKIKYSVQMTFVTIFSVFIAVTIAMLNIFPTTSARDIVFSSKQSSLMGRTSVISASLSALEKLSGEGVSQVMSLIGADSFDRIVVTDQEGTILYDTDQYGQTGDSEKRANIVFSALGGKAVFSSHYSGRAFQSRAAAPVMSYGGVIGAVYIYENDTEQAALINSIQLRLRGISVLLGVVTLVVICLFTTALTRRIRELVQGIRIVREGDYAYRVAPAGRDEVRELSEEFNEMTERLWKTEELRRRFVSDASHELRTPLASIRLLSDSILQSDNMDEATMREFVTDIGSEAERLQRMTEKLMKLTKMDSNLRSERARVSLKKVTERAVHLLKPLAEQKRVAMHTQLEDDGVILASEDDVYQIIFNLAENAIKYNNADGDVFLRLSREGDEVVMLVEDTGIGIPDEDIPHIFDRFYRVDKARSRARGGSGLGLSIVRDAVKTNGGEITVEHRERVGTRFIMRFPLCLEDNET